MLNSTQLKKYLIQAAISTSHMAGLGMPLGELRVDPQPDGSKRVFITVPQGHSSLPYGSYLVPGCMVQKVQYSLFGRLDRRKDQAHIIWVHPNTLATYLLLLGYPDVGSVRKAAQGDAKIPLLSREALEGLGQGGLWPPGWPPGPPPGFQPPPPGIQIVEMADDLHLPAPVGFSTPHGTLRDEDP